MKLVSTLSLILSRVALLQVLWKKWDIRTSIIGSFTLQLVLILLAPLRKRTPNLILRASLWASYLLADSVSAQAIGLITRATEPGCQLVSESQGYLFSFWAQFLLIHLGGPDTITALALEDTELWLRTALHLGTQAYGSLGVLFRSTRSSGLWAATVLMFLAGIIKYLERVMSLFHGRLMNGLDEDPRPYAKKLIENQLANVDTEDQSEKEEDPLTNVEIVRDAFNLYHCNKRVFMDRKLSIGVRRSTREYFMRRTSEEVYKVLEIQINFTYEAIYTKMVIIHKTAWKILRHIAFLLQVAGLVIWCLDEKKGYQEYDIRITYTLVVGAIAVDVLAFLRVHLSDWNIARLNEKACWIEFYNKLLSWKEPILVEVAESESESESILLFLLSWFRRVFLVRLSQSIHQLGELTTKEAKTKILYRVATCIKLESYAMRQVMEKKTILVSSELWDLIFEVVMGSDVDDDEDESSKRYKMVASGEEIDIDSLVDRVLPSRSLEDDYGGALMRWSNLTLNLCNNEESPIQERTLEFYSFSRISMTIQSYFRYLTLFQQDMMFGAAGKETLLTETDPIFRRDDPCFSSSDDENEEDRSEGVKNIFDMKEVLNDIQCEDGKLTVKWELVARGWVKLLCYTAIKCRPDVHAKKLKEAGELLSFIWLFMLNLDVDV